MNYHKKVLPIIRQVRKILMPHYGIAKTIHQKEAEASSIVTKLDIKVEEFLRVRLKKTYPLIEFVGEELGGSRDFDIFWLVDPIDATGHYVRGLPFCTTMLVLIKNQQPIFSAIYDFVNDKMYWAEKGVGAYLEKNRIKVGKRSLRDSYIATEIRIEKPANLKKYLELRKKIVPVQTISAGWEYAMIASGKLDGRICYDPYGKDYDFTPGALLVMEAGGVVTNVGSKLYDYRNTSLIATNKKIYKELTTGHSATFPIS